MATYNIIDGGIYKLPVDSQYPLIFLKDLKNLGHNSVKGTCANCGYTDTYSKSDLQECKVYMCKHCNSAVYKRGFATLQIMKVTNRQDGKVIASCKCKDCGRTDDYDFNKIMAGKVLRCRHCFKGAKLGTPVGTNYINRIEVNKTDITKSMVYLRCGKCKKDVMQATVYELLIQKNRAVIGARCKDCYKPKEQPLSKPKVSIPKENDSYKNISDAGMNKVYATCKNCGYTGTFSTKHVIDEESCPACRFIEKGFTVCQEPMNKKILARNYNDTGKNIILKNKSKFSLTVSDMKNVAKQYKMSRKSSALCTCNTCNQSDTYDIVSISGEDALKQTCKVCGYKYILGTVYDEDLRTHSSLFISDISRFKERPYATLKCTKCGSEVKTPLSSVDIVAPNGCESCKIRARYKITNAKFGTIFDIDDETSTDYQLVGTYMVLSNTAADNKRRIVAQCTECGNIIDAEFKDFDDFISTVEAGCKQCNSFAKQTKNYINNNNWVGYIKHCKKTTDVIDRGNVKIAVTKCLMCGKVKEIPLTTFVLASKIVCDSCIDKKVVIKCPICNGIHNIELTVRDIYDTDKQAICPAKQQRFSMSRCRLAHEHQCKLDYLVQNFPDFDDYTEINGLIKSNSMFYKGTDGNKYNTCYCPEHNKMLTLRDDEILEYQHQFCADSRMYGYMK